MSLAAICPETAVTSEVLLVGLHGSNEIHLAVIATCREFGAHVVARNPTALVVQFCGSNHSVDCFLAHLPAGCVTHVCRSALPTTAESVAK
ncbi:MAG: hypothetical protein Q8M02_00910 [Candidatus Didemnitutus sp.]|nr:hypothetical protein [Candidatus Didemnitutus sp.]